MNGSIGQSIAIQKILNPEDDQEKEFLNDSCFQEGLLWGKPRFGHPEGKIIFHVAEVLENIEKLSLDTNTRKLLRLVAFVHDTFKIKEDQFGYPRTWNQNHAFFAREYLEKFTSNPFTLELVEHHDAAYFAWRNICLNNNVEKGSAMIEDLKRRFGDNLQKYYLFFKCDTRTGDKNQTPLKWFEDAFKDIEKVSF